MRSRMRLLIGVLPSVESPVRHFLGMIRRNKPANRQQRSVQKEDPDASFERQEGGDPA
jgi:hypothetical protein